MRHHLSDPNTLLWIDTTTNHTCHIPCAGHVRSSGLLPRKELWPRYRLPISVVFTCVKASPYFLIVDAFQATHGKLVMSGCTDPLVVRYADAPGSSTLNNFTSFVTRHLPTYVSAFNPLRRSEGLQCAASIRMHISEVAFNLRG